MMRDGTRSTSQASRAQRQAKPTRQIASHPISARAPRSNTLHYISDSRPESRALVPCTLDSALSFFLLFPRISAQQACWQTTAESVSRFSTTKNAAARGKDILAPGFEFNPLAVIARRPF